MGHVTEAPGKRALLGRGRAGGGGVLAPCKGSGGKPRLISDATLPTGACPHPPASPRARFPVLRWLGHRQGPSQASVTPWAGSSNQLSASLCLTFPDQSKSATRLCLSLTRQVSEAAPGNRDWGIPVLTLGHLVDQRRRQCMGSMENSP